MMLTQVLIPVIFIEFLFHFLKIRILCVGAGGGYHTFTIFTYFMCMMLGIALRASHILN